MILRKEELIAAASASLRSTSMVGKKTAGLICTTEDFEDEVSIAK